jgi:hypothetical protein
MIDPLDLRPAVGANRAGAIARASWAVRTASVDIADLDGGPA